MCIRDSFKIIPFIATLATLNVFNGIGLLLSTGRQVFYKNEAFLKIGSISYWFLPLMAVIWLVIAIIVNHILDVYKRQPQACGSCTANPGCPPYSVDKIITVVETVVKTFGFLIAAL